MHYPFFTYFLWFCAAIALCIATFINTDMILVENKNERIFLTIASLWTSVSGFVFGMIVL